MKYETVAVILSGGKNTRMNYKEKAFLQKEGKLFIEKIIEDMVGFKEIAISCNNIELYKRFSQKCRIVSDIKKNIGPMGGIYSIFKEMKAEKIFVIAADMPFIDSSIIDAMNNVEFTGDALVVCSNGNIEPLCAIYKNTILDKLEELIDIENYKMMSLINGVNTSYFYLNDESIFRNINTPKQYLEVIKNKESKHVSNKPTIINVVASCSNSGKTTLIEGIIKKLKKKNYIVSTIKHDVHGFDIDKEGKDTYKHRMAGADNVSISSNKRFALIRELDEELSLDEIINVMPQSDFIIIEGFKKSKHRKIEVFRKGISKSIVTERNKLIAVATDEEDLDVDGIVVNLNDYDTIVQLIEKEADLCIQ